jgi:phage terminase small subunit
MEADAMTQAAIKAPMAREAATRSASRYLCNDEAAEFLKLSPRTLEKQRVIGGGPKFRKFGRRVVYAIEDLESWANARSCDTTSDPNYSAVTR